MNGTDGRCKGKGRSGGAEGRIVRHRDGTITVTVPLPAKLRRRLSRVARRLGITRSQLVVLAMNRDLGKIEGRDRAGLRMLNGRG